MLRSDARQNASTRASLSLHGRSKRIQLTKKQGNVYVWGWQPTARFRYIVAGRRWGKTFLLMEELRRAVRLAIERDIDTDMEIWYGGVTKVQAEKNFWKRAIRACPPEWIEKIDNSKHTITYKSGHVFRLVGLDNHDDLRGSGLFFFMGDEFADVKPEAWTATIRPMLATCEGHALFIGTPKGYNHFYDRYAEGQPGEGKDDETMSWKYTTIEGGNVPQKEIDAARKSTDEKTFRQEWEASFETYTGNIYYGFDRKKNIAFPPWHNHGLFNKSLPVHVGLDFNIDPMTAHIFQEAVVNGVLTSWQIDEIHIMSSNTHEMGNEIAARYELPSFDPATPKRDHITIYPDPAGAGRRTSAHGETDVTILRRMGFSVMAMSSHPLVRDRINALNGKFCAADGIKTADGTGWIKEPTRALFIVPTCKKSIESAEKQQYKEGTSEPDKDGGFDHDNDAKGYYVYTRFFHQKPRIETIIHMGR